MADDDDDKKGSRDNTGRDHKPANARNNENAPRGQLGTNRLTPPGLSLGGRSPKTWATQTAEQKPQSQDNQAYSIATGDEAVDKQAAETNRVISREEAEKMIGRENVARHLDEKPQKPEGPRISQSDFAKAFRQANQKTQSMQQSRGLDHD
jgi:hypothetical protein